MFVSGQTVLMLISTACIVFGSVSNDTVFLRLSVRLSVLSKSIDCLVGLLLWARRADRLLRDQRSAASASSVALSADAGS